MDMMVLPTGYETEPECPPPGCDSDAVKLFVGNIPKSFREAQLFAFFETFGKVVELVIIRDKKTHKSKGSAFLWYSNLATAQAAVLHFNLRFTLVDDSGREQLLVVRQAHQRQNPQATATHQQQHAAAYTASGHTHVDPVEALWLHDLQDSSYPRVMIQQQQKQLPSSRSSFSSSYSPSYNCAGQSPYSGPCSSSSNVQMSSEMMTANLGQDSAAALMGTEALCWPADLDMLELGFQEKTLLAAPPAADPPVPAAANTNLNSHIQSVLVNQHQLMHLEQHLYSIQTVSGACLNITAQAPTIFSVCAVGGEDQVALACLLLTTMSALSS